MSHNWKSTPLSSEEETLRVLAELKGKRWMCRGQPRHCCDGLRPSIDRKPRQNLSRLEKLTLERQSIDIFRSTARFFVSEGERNALVDDVSALMVLRHYEVPTRLLDWSMSPYVAAYFAVKDKDTDNGEIWSFDEPLFELDAEKKQWEKWPETTIKRSGKGPDFLAGLTAFTIEEPPSNWFACYFYRPGFPRQQAQDGAYTMTARFGRDHAEAIEEFFDESSRHHLYVISATLKATLRQYLREKHGIWRGSLFPDSAGAAQTARMVLEDDGK
jgi:hypothetical protein